MPSRPVLFPVLLCASLASAATSISGDIHTVTFNASGSPYIVEKDVRIPQGKSVAMGAGTVLLFKAFAGLRVDGGLAIEGTLEEPVVFTSVHDREHGTERAQLPNPFE